MFRDLGNNEDRTPSGGLAIADGITNKDFYQMLHIVLITSLDCIFKDDDGERPEDNRAFVLGTIRSLYVELGFGYSILFPLLYAKGQQRRGLFIYEERPSLRALNTSIQRCNPSSRWWLCRFDTETPTLLRISSRTHLPVSIHRTLG